MKKLTLVICVLAMLLAFTGVASADDDGLVRDTIEVSGYLTELGTVTQISPYLIKIEGMEASGTVLSSELFGGASFSIDDEDAIINLRALRGINWGRITIATNDGEVHIRFAGRTFDLNPETMEGSVAGGFRVVGGTGEFEELRGAGRYSGDAAPLFTLTFTGWFYTDSD